MNPAKQFTRLVGRLGADPLLKESFWFGGSTIAEQLSKLFTGVAAAAVLGPAVWGHWYLLNLVLQYGSVLHLGAVNGMNREVPALLGKGDIAGAERMQRSALGSLIVAYAAAGCLLLLVALLMVTGGRAPAAQEWLRDLGLTLMLSATQQVFTFAITALRSRTMFGAVSRLQLAAVVVYPLLSLPLAWQFGLSGFIVGQALGYLALSLVGALTNRGMYRVSLVADDVR